MTQRVLLQGLVTTCLFLAPLGTQSLLRIRGRPALVSHGTAAALAALGLWTPMPQLTCVWLLFSIWACVRAWRVRPKAGFGPGALAGCVPFAFGVVSAVWIVGAANDLRILGYGPAFSFYAALHGLVLGWMVTGAVAVLAAQAGPRRWFYAGAVYANFLCFFLIALGIDGLSWSKAVGVVGLSATLMATQWRFLRDAWRVERAGFWMGCIACLALCCTLLLAWMHHVAGLWPELSFAGAPRAMVTLHGSVNALVVAPCFQLAVRAHVIARSAGAPA